MIPTVDDDEWDASSMASIAGDASPSSQPNEAPVAAPNMEIIQRLDLMNKHFSTKFDGVLDAIKEVNKEVRDFSGRMDEAEGRISKVEDAVNSGKAKTADLVKQVELLTHKVDDLENRSRRSNLRLVNLPEKAEGSDAIAFLEKWLPEALGPTEFPSPPIIERAHRIPSGTQHAPTRPRVLIIKFLNFQDKVRAMRAARSKDKVLYGEQKVMFFPDISAELQRRRKLFDGVKQQLRSMDVRYGLVYPARLRMTVDGRTHEFNTPADAENFIKGLKRPSNIEGT